jgi:tetratricopeptide (TPR) repeat protein
MRSVARSALALAAFCALASAPRPGAAQEAAAPGRPAQAAPAPGPAPASGPEAVTPGPEPPAPAAPESSPDAAAALPPDLEASLAGLGEDANALRALVALGDGRPVEARELAEKQLAAQPDAYPAHCVLGLVQGQIEGNLARALHHFERCRALFEARHGTPDESNPWLWHRMAIEGLVRVATDMGRSDEALASIDAWDRAYGGDHRRQRAWVLAKTGKLRESRELAQAILADVEDANERAAAWQILCVVDAEERDAAASYDACKQAAELSDAQADPVHLTNAAEAASGVLRMDEAERWLVEATQREFPGSLAAPWGELAYLYLLEGRLAEAVEAVREARTASRRQRADVNAQTRAWHDLVAAGVLLVAGHPKEAERLAVRAEARPDRLGRVSSDEPEVTAAVALVTQLASRTAAAELEERASTSEWRPALRLHLDAAVHRFRAWLAGRRAVALYADRERLSSRIQPHAPGFVELPEWVENDLVSLVGPGVMAAALADARARGFVDDEHGYAQALEAEIARARGRDAAALAKSEAALARLPAWEALLRARVAATGADAALAQGDDARAQALFDLVFQLDPGVLRRMELALPARVETGSGQIAGEAARLLRGSPRLRDSERGFRVEVSEAGGAARACLGGAGGVVVRCAEVAPDANEAPDATARRLAAAFHREVFAPRVDLSQADLRALDGSNTVAAEHSRERVRIVLRDILAE